MFAHRAAVADPAGEPRMVVSRQRRRLFSVFRLLLDIGLPAPRLKPVIGKADFGTGETSAVGGVGLDRLQQVVRPDPVFYGLFNLGDTGRFAAQSVRWIGCQNLLSLPRLALARRRFFLRFNGKVRVPI